MRADGVPGLYHPRLVFQSDWCYCPLPVAHITALDEGLQSGYHLQLARCVYSPLLQRSRAGAFSTRRKRRRWRAPLVRPWLPNFTRPQILMVSKIVQVRALSTGLLCVEEPLYWLTTCCEPKESWNLLWRTTRKWTWWRPLPSEYGTKETLFQIKRVLWGAGPTSLLSWFG